MRLPNWEFNLANFLKRSAKRQFKWGEFDCCLFACDAAKIVNGIDGAVDFRGRYTTRIGAFKALKKYGKTTVADTLSFVFGNPVPLLLANRGDIALVNNNGEQIAAVVFNGIWAVSESGLIQLSSDDVIHCWSIT